jgi:hypothetical protein
MISEPNAGGRRYARRASVRRGRKACVGGAGEDLKPACPKSGQADSPEKLPPRMAALVAAVTRMRSCITTRSRG